MWLLADSTCNVIIKWSKTLQDRRNKKTISLPYLAASPLCPVAALKVMFAAYPAARNDPLFAVSVSSHVVSLSDSTARKHLQRVSVMLNISPALTFHAFRRSGTTWAFQNGVPIQDIMAHGTWSSDSVLKYIKSVPSSSSPVSRAFQSSLMF